MTTINTNFKSLEKKTDEHAVTPNELFDSILGSDSALPLVHEISEKGNYPSPIARGVEARRKRLIKNNIPVLSNMEDVIEDKSSDAVKKNTPITIPDLRYIGPEDSINTTSTKVAEKPVEELVEKPTKPEIAPEPVKAEDMVTIGPDGGVVDQKPEEVSGVVEKFDQPLPKDAKVVNKEIVAEAVGKTGLSNQEENRKRAENVFKDSLPQEKPIVSAVVSASEIGPEKIVDKIDEQPSGSKILEVSDDATVISSSDDETKKLSEMIENNVPLVDSQSPIPADPTALSDEQLRVETLGQKPEEVVPPKPVAEIQLNPPMETAQDVPVSVVQNTDNAKLIKPAGIPTTAGHPEFFNPARKRVTDSINAEKTKSTQNQLPEPETVVPKVESPSVANAEEVPPTDKIEQSPAATIAKPTEQQASEGIIGEIKPAESASADIAKPVAEAPIAPPVPKGQRHSFFQGWFRKVAATKDEPTSDIVRKAEEAVNNARKGEELEKAA